MNEDNLQKGLAIAAQDKKTRVRNAFVMYSGEYIPGTKLTDKTARYYFECEVMKITNAGKFMGMFQVFALSSVLKNKIFSVYPLLGSPQVRKDLHRLILPRETHSQTQDFPLVVMWTSTRCDMLNRNWLPNHFVPALERTNFQATAAFSVSHTYTSGQEDKDNIPPPEELVGQWIIVQHIKKPYPGFVEEVYEEDVYVDCMHSVGRGTTNCFFWPQKLRDLCYYEYEAVLAVIPKPTLKVGSQGHFEVDADSWEIALQKIKQ